MKIRLLLPFLFLVVSVVQPLAAQSIDSPSVDLDIVEKIIEDTN